MALKRNYRSGSAIEMLGCSVAELRTHLESKFLPGMTWENYGMHGWHIDHIQPCASFDLTKPEEQAKCFHYTNIQPLYKNQSFIKSDKINGVSARRKNWK